MRVILFGATGMVGQGVLKACLADPAVTEVLCVGRSAPPDVDPKLHSLVHADLYDYSTIAAKLVGYDACFFCLGVSAGGMSEADYRRVTYDLTLAAARAILAASPSATFVYVSGAGTDSSEKGLAMWARVKGQTENALLALGFPRAYMFRPGLIEPKDGIKSKTASYRVFYAISAPFFPLIRALAPSLSIDTRVVGRAMILVARSGASKPILENRDLAALGAA